ncbi:preprotein translocase subunit YajC [Knoellia sinensis KCTC 19936]|uniref:Preprotein translocase subunit YajC n=1 Tax=Knoellia sinensis KCTC 19936 TaxID=1385520 RepID=A0A0A0J975_9MICO|nr:preprotein translocase subunit YajC [Knoellia sinensis KCTC 19936]
MLALPLLLLAFLMFSQRKRGRQIQDFQASLSVGDKVVLTSGLYGTITALDDVVATLEVAPGVQVRADRRAVGLSQPESGPSTTTPDTTPEAS